MSLPSFFKLHIVNNTGASIQFSTDGANNNMVITGLPWKYTSGAIEYGSEVTLFADPSSDLADNASTEGAEYDNSSNKWLGMFCRATFDSDNTSAGAVDIMWEWSTDGSASGTYVSDETDFDAEQDLRWLSQVTSAGSANEARGVTFEIGAVP